MSITGPNNQTNRGTPMSLQIMLFPQFPKIRPASWLNAVHLAEPCITQTRIKKREYIAPWAGRWWNGSDIALSTWTWRGFPVRKLTIQLVSSPLGSCRGMAQGEAAGDTSCLYVRCRPANSVECLSRIETTHTHTKKIDSPFSFAK